MDLLSQAVQQSGMIQPGSHPEFDQPTAGEKIMGAFKKMFGGGGSIKTAAQKSGAVQRTSDIPRSFTDVEADSILGRSRNPTRTSDKPVVKLGQGIQGGAHKNTGTGGQSY